MLLEINRICAQLIFSDEYEMNNSVKFLDVTLTRRPTDIDSFTENQLPQTVFVPPNGAQISSRNTFNLLYEFFFFEGPLPLPPKKEQWRLLFGVFYILIPIQLTQ